MSIINFVIQLEVKLNKLVNLSILLTWNWECVHIKKGSTGAACEHQAAVTKHFRILLENIAPAHSKEAHMQ